MGHHPLGRELWGRGSGAAYVLGGSKPRDLGELDASLLGFPLADLMGPGAQLRTSGPCGYIAR